MSHNSFVFVVYVYVSGVQVRFRRKKERSSRAARRIATRPPLETKPSQVVDDDHLFWSAALFRKPLHKFHVGDNLYHDCEEEHGTEGTPSAFLMEARSGDCQLMLHCFACNTPYFVMPTHRPPLYQCTHIIEEPNPKAFLKLHPIMLGSRRLTVIDANCGAGKTKGVADWVSGLIPEETILSANFRKALALTLSDKLNLNCYTGIEDGTRTGSLKWRRATVVLNSMVRIPHDIMNAEVRGLYVDVYVDVYVGVYVGVDALGAVRVRARAY